MILKFGQMRPLVSMATDRVTVGKRCHHVFSNVFDRIHFILADNDDIHKLELVRNSARSDYGLRSWLPLSV